MAVVIFGSINMDLVVKTPRLPRPGETLPGHTFFTAPGGKGANQAVAAARMGAVTRMVGRLGDDVFAGALRASLESYGVDTKGVSNVPNTPCGVALIQVDDRAENSIVYVAGANATLGEESLNALEQALEGAKALLLQLEVPLVSVEAAARIAQERKVSVILDPAPAQPLPDSLFGLVNLTTPNQVEAEMLTGIAADTPDGARRAAQALLARGVGDVVIKMAGQGIFWAKGDQHIPAFPVTPVDTVAAGDAFNGALAAALDEGLPMTEALRWAQAAGAISVTRAGAQPSMPNRTEVLDMLGR